MRIPDDVQSLDDMYRFLFSRLDAESCFKLQALLREYETEAAELWMKLGRREMLVFVQEPSRN